MRVGAGARIEFSLALHFLEHFTEASRHPAVLCSPPKPQQETNECIDPLRVSVDWELGRGPKYSYSEGGLGHKLGIEEGDTMVTGKEASRVQVESIDIFRKLPHAQYHWGTDGGGGAMKDKAEEYHYQIFVLERSFWNGKRPGRSLRRGLQSYGWDVIWGKLGQQQWGQRKVDRSEKFMKIQLRNSSLCWEVRDAMLKLGWMVKWNKASVLKGIGFRTCHGNDFSLLGKSDTIRNWINFPNLSDRATRFAIPSELPTLLIAPLPNHSTSGSWSSSSPDLWCRNLTCASDPLFAPDLSLPQPREQKMLICLSQQRSSLELGMGPAIPSILGLCRRGYS